MILQALAEGKEDNEELQAAREAVEAQLDEAEQEIARRKNELEQVRALPSTFTSRNPMFSCDQC